MSNKGEIAALISLLDDEDEEILENVSGKLVSLGKSVLPMLDEAWGSTELSTIHFEKIEDIITKIQFLDVYNQLEIWKEDALHNVLDGSLIVAQLFYPSIDKESTYTLMNQLKQKIWLELNNSYTPLENINIFNQVFYNLVNFEGLQSNQVNYADYCVNNVLESKKGSAIALGIIYSSLAQALELPVYGVNLYKNFILAYQKNFIFDYDLDAKDETIFYMSPLNTGASFFNKEIEKYLKSLSEPKLDKYFIPAPPIEIIKELIQYMTDNLLDKSAEKTLKIKQLKELSDLLST